MREINRNLMTLYADLLQRSEDPTPWQGYVARKTIGGKVHLYITQRGTRKQTYLGPQSNPKVAAKASAIQRLQSYRRTVSVLKRARIPSPSTAFGRMLEVLADAGIFRSGAVLVGTVAYQIYPCVIGKFLSSSALQTQDADIALKAKCFEGGESLELVLQRANPSFKGRPSMYSQWPKTFEAKDGLSLDVLTPGHGEKVVRVKSLECSAQQVRGLEYLMEDPLEAIALYGAGVPVRVPQPARYAVHKLIVASRRKVDEQRAAKEILQARELFEGFEKADLADAIQKVGKQKATKDILQARELFEALEKADLADAIQDARRRGPSWRKAVDAGLKRAGLGAA